MSGRSYERKELMQWGYAALVCIALAFTTITGASANTKPAEVRPTLSENGKWEACLLPPKGAEPIDKQSCDSTAAASTDATHGLNQLINSALVNSLGSNKSIYPLRDDRVY